MRVQLALLLFVLIASSPAAADDSPPSEPGLPLVVLLGDSIRMNYQAEAAAALTGTAEVWSPKDNCRHTEFMFENLDRWLERRGSLRWSIINVGLHDMYLQEKTGKPKHTLATYERNLRAIFAKLDALTDAQNHLCADDSGE